jgi:hypothetical protein
VAVSNVGEVKGEVMTPRLLASSSHVQQRFLGPQVHRPRTPSRISKSVSATMLAAFHLPLVQGGTPKAGAEIPADGGGKLVFSQTSNTQSRALHQ